MTTADWALVLSLFSVTLALAGFVWNVWSKFIFPKPKVRTSFTVMNVLEDGKEPLPVLSLTATNYGPGPVTLYCALGRKRPKLFGRLLRRGYRVGLLNPLHGFPQEGGVVIGPFGGGLPKKIEVGEAFNAYFVFKHEGLRDSGFVDVGFEDTFGRYQWAPRRQVRKVIEQIKKEFPRQEGL